MNLYSSENTVRYFNDGYICHFIFVQTHRIYTTESEPYTDLGTLGVCHMSV